MSKTEKRNEILQSALELIAEFGFHGAPMAMIAERAGVGAGTIYRYFESKDVLIQELFRDLEARATAHVQVGYDEELPVKERFLHLCTALLRYFLSFPLEFRYLEQYHNSPYGTDYRRDKLYGDSNNRHPFKELIEQGVALQIIKDLPLVALFALWIGPLTSLARDNILGFVQVDDKLSRQVAEACWDAVKR
ncbi:MAG: TetR/AcrR family transcriptional regulator [Deltaproteobacteria bacterium]|nr:TetR/AcrR family transcriptional regulator [Deltaproteobacteria bacterium]